MTIYVNEDFEADDDWDLASKVALPFALATRMFSAHTMSATWSPTENESVLAIRVGSHPMAHATSSTVAPSASNSVVPRFCPNRARCARPFRTAFLSTYGFGKEIGGLEYLRII